MNNKKLVMVLVVLMMAAAHTVQAQSQAKKLLADLERTKQQQQAVLLKAQQQQRGISDDRKVQPNTIAVPPQDANHASRTATPLPVTNPMMVPAAGGQPALINKPRKKEVQNQ